MTNKISYSRINGFWSYDMNRSHFTARPSSNHSETEFMQHKIAQPSSLSMPKFLWPKGIRQGRRTIGSTKQKEVPPLNYNPGISSPQIRELISTSSIKTNVKVDGKYECMMHFNSIPLHNDHPNVLLPRRDPHHENFQKPKTHRRQNPPPPHKQTCERLITFLNKKYARHVHPSHPYLKFPPNLKTGTKFPQNRVSISTSLPYMNQYELQHTNAWYTSTPPHSQYILGYECSVSSHQSPQRKFSKTPKRKIKIIAEPLLRPQNFWMEDHIPPSKIMRPSLSLTLKFPPPNLKTGISTPYLNIVSLASNNTKWNI